MAKANHSFSHPYEAHTLPGLDSTYMHLEFEIIYILSRSEVNNMIYRQIRKATLGTIISPKVAEIRLFI